MLSPAMYAVLREAELLSKYDRTDGGIASLRVRRIGIPRSAPGAEALNTSGKAVPFAMKHSERFPNWDATAAEVAYRSRPAHVFPMSYAVCATLTTVRWYRLPLSRVWVMFTVLSLPWAKC